MGHNMNNKPTHMYVWKNPEKWYMKECVIENFDPKTQRGIIRFIATGETGFVDRRALRRIQK